MCTVWYARDAQDDLTDIALTVAENGVDRALMFIDGLEAHCKKLATMPHMGRERSELAATLRSFPFPPYVIFYLPRQSGVAVVRILHESRDIGTVFS